MSSIILYVLKVFCSLYIVLNMGKLAEKITNKIKKKTEQPIPRKSKKTAVDIKQAIKLKKQGVSYQQIADLQGVPRTTLQSAVGPLLAAIPGHEHLEEYRKCQAEIIDSMAVQVLTAISADDIANASLKDKATSFAILLDKSRLVQDKSTSNNAVSLLLTGAGRADLLHTSSGGIIEAELLE